jgi:hypothetical protein
MSIKQKNKEVEKKIMGEFSGLGQVIISNIELTSLIKLLIDKGVITESEFEIQKEPSYSFYDIKLAKKE